MSELRVDSRWWYWVAAVPVVTAFWAVSALWTGVVVALVPEAVVGSAESVVSLPAVALGLPALVAFLALPLALWMDARAVDAAGGGWPTPTDGYARLAVGVDAVVFGGAVLFFDGFGPLAAVAEVLTLDGVAAALASSAFDTGGLGLFLVAVGAVAGSWLCVEYLRERRERVAMPGSLREWRAELRADEVLR
ncbi:hypothetical protein [Halobacterium yunchengense]|uniref:hypothetical protein n=1 Tax=Halobacterium yunchengense TaxID=3108497 RepID=UPI00300A9982